MQHEHIKEMSFKMPKFATFSKLNQIWLVFIRCIFQQNHVSVGWKAQSKIIKMKVQTTT